MDNVKRWPHMQEIFEEAHEMRRQHEQAVTSISNFIRYESPIAAKEEIWPPLAAVGENQNGDPLGEEVLKRLFVPSQRPYLDEPPTTPTVEMDRLYEPLYEGHIIRLVELQPAKFDDALELVFHHADLRKPHLPYEALSYVWGKPPRLPKKEQQSIEGRVNVNGYSLRVSINLEQALRHLRSTNKSRLLWADSVCIHQSDLRERGHQVSLMSEVYRNACRVVIWLGDIQKEAEFEYASTEIRDMNAEHAFGAVCEIVNHWISGKNSQQRASYRIIERDQTAENESKGEVFETFEIDSRTIQKSTFIQNLLSTPIMGSHDETMRDFSKLTEVYQEERKYYWRGAWRTYPVYNSSVSVATEPSVAKEPYNDPKLQATLDTATTSIFWQSIRRLFSSPWFWRLWVFQEVVLARSAVVRWGHCEIDWQYVGLTSAILRTNHLAICENLKIGGLYNALLMFRMSKMSDLPPIQVDFLRVMQLTRQFEVTDPRDRVFGLLGIEMDDNDPHQGNLYMKPDYEIEAATLWRNLAQKMIMQKSQLSLLSSVQYSIKMLEIENAAISESYPMHRLVGQITPDYEEFRGYELPSWVPRWDFAFRTTLSPWALNETFTASKGLAVSYTRVDGDRLVVMGAAAGLVVNIFPAMKRDIDLSLLWSSKLHEYFKTEHGLRLLASTLTAGRNAYGSLAPNSDAVLADLAAYILSLNQKDDETNGQHQLWPSDYEKIMKEVPDPQLFDRLAVDGNAERFRETAMVYCKSRRLFVTASGFLGLGPNVVVEGDILAVLAGGDLPFVLRPKLRSNASNKVGDQDRLRGTDELKYHLLVGESYVPGLMAGQMDEKLRTNSKVQGPLEPALVMKDALSKFVHEANERYDKREFRKAIEADESSIVQVKLKPAELRTFELR